MTVPTQSFRGAPGFFAKTFRRSEIIPTCQRSPSPTYSSTVAVRVTVMKGQGDRVGIEIFKCCRPWRRVKRRPLTLKAVTRTHNLPPTQTDDSTPVHNGRLLEQTSFSTLEWEIQLRQPPTFRGFRRRRRTSVCGTRLGIWTTSYPGGAGENSVLQLKDGGQRHGVRGAYTQCLLVSCCRKLRLPSDEIIADLGIVS